MLGYEDPIEARRDLRHPRFTIKTPNTLIGYGEDIRAPRGAIRPEVEIALITKRKIKGGLDMERDILGYTVFNDITAPALASDDAYYAYRRDPATGEIRREYIRGLHLLEKT